MAQSDFGQALAGAERRMERAAVELARTRRLLEREDMAGAFGSAFAFSAEVEKLALLARVLPAYTGHPKAAELTEQMLLDTVPIEMGYARRGWFLLKIPALLPKKGTDRLSISSSISIPPCAATSTASRRRATAAACWLTGMCISAAGRSGPTATMTTLRSTW